MPVTNYLTVNGTIRSESTNGVRTNYIRDALGSVVATTHEAGEVQNTYRYKPSGALLNKTGVADDPKFMWVGSYGSRTSGTRGATNYNRARHYGAAQATWTRLDPLWPHAPGYSYCNGNPSTHRDSNGLYIDIDDTCKGTGFNAGKCCSDLLDTWPQDGNFEQAIMIWECMKPKGLHNSFDWILRMLDFLADTCKNKPGTSLGGGRNPRVCVRCEGDSLTIPNNCPACKGSSLASTIDKPFMEFIKPSEGQNLCYGSSKGCESLIPKGCDCTIIMCKLSSDEKYDTQFCELLFHELTHCSGTGHNDIPPLDTDFVYAFSCCLCESIYGEGSDKCSVNCRAWR